ISPPSHPRRPCRRARGDWRPGNADHRRGARPLQAAPQAQRRILADLGTPGKALNQKLTAWWNLDFPAFRAEIQKVFKRDIPLKDRDDWEEWLLARRAEHQQRTEAIVRMETELNACVYALFDLTTAEITIIEESTKYQYGEV
ncbi:MAG: hypothetical protein M3R61_19515, partial [Chloroflexota bacterium]|nr:hypothetical protein [Chloroflexota bacterium]